MTILIYRSQFPFTRDARVRCMLEELGVPYETAMVHLLGDTSAFQKVHPRGKVPFLVEDDRQGERLAISESGAILLHLAEKHDVEGKLLPRNSLERARVYQWLFHTVTEIDPALGGVFANKVFFKGKEGAEEAARASEAIFAKLTGFLEAALDGHEFLVGDKLSLADLALVVTLDWGARVGALTSYPRIAAYHARLASRPAIAKVLGEAAPKSTVAA